MAVFLAKKLTFVSARIYVCLLNVRIACVIMRIILCNELDFRAFSVVRYDVSMPLIPIDIMNKTLHCYLANDTGNPYS